MAFNRAMIAYGSEESSRLRSRLSDVDRLMRQRRALGLYSPGTERRLYSEVLRASGEKAHQRAMLRLEEEHRSRMEEMERERLNIAKQQERRAAGYGPVIAAQQAAQDQEPGVLSYIGAVASAIGAIAGLGSFFGGGEKAAGAAAGAAGGK